MRVAGIIAEYNPFHDGHAYHIRQTRQAGADAVVVVMSGNYVQRGSPAILSKWARAEAAARCGADLVLELPVPWAIGRAQTFADGAVSALRALGVVDTLSFGSECGDVDRLCSAADALRDAAVYDAMRLPLSEGLSFAASRERAVRSLYGDEAADVLHNANDTLACEFIRACSALGAAFSFLAVRRIGAHDGAREGEGFCCASQIRAHLAAGGGPEGCPEAMQAIWRRESAHSAAGATLEHMERAVLQKLRESSVQQLLALPDVSEGLENRLLSAARQADSLESLYSLVKTKRYPLARIRRIVLSAFLDVRAADIPARVPYLRVLAAGEKGTQILRLASKTCAVPIVTRTSDAAAAEGSAKSIWELENKADERYALLLPRPQPWGEALRHSAFIQKTEETV